MDLRSVRKKKIHIIHQQTKQNDRITINKNERLHPRYTGDKQCNPYYTVAVLGGE